MPTFDEDLDTDRLDWNLLRYGAVALYWRRELIERDTDWLQEHGYTIYTIDCSTRDVFHEQMTRELRFGELFGYEPWTGNLDALNDAFRWIEFDGVTGVVFCFHRYDLLTKADKRLARETLDIIEFQSRDYLLYGHRLLALVQSDDPNIHFDGLGGRAAWWNNDEWFNASRGL